MPSIEFKKKVEIVTPAFPGGPDNKPSAVSANDIDRDGIRTSAIIYGMRWWFRALAGAIRGTADLDNIRKAESLIFGTAQSLNLSGKPYAGLASRVRIAITANINPERDLEKFEQADLWLKYLAYGLFPTDRRKDDFSRRMVKPGAKFEFSVRVCPPRRLDPESPESPEPEIPLALLESLADLWIELGGLGGRWRHGLGGMRLADSPVLVKPNDYPVHLRKRITVALDHVKEFLAQPKLGIGQPPVQSSALPDFPICKDPFFKIAWRAQAGFDASGALKAVQQIWRGTRQTERGNPRSSSRNAPLYRDVRDRTAKTGAALAEFAGLGMPIPFGFPQSSNRYTGAVIPSKEITRRASPIWFRVIKVHDKQYGLLALLWDSVYLPDNQNQVSVGKDNQLIQVAFNPREAERWFEQLVKSTQDRFIKG